MSEDLEKRQTKLEDAITKLTEISADLNKMVAVHELRISHQEKITDSLEIILEKRRYEFEDREKQIYSEMKEEESRIMKNIDDNYTTLLEKIGELEKMMWTYGGGVIVLAFIIANWGDVLKILQK